VNPENPISIDELRMNVHVFDDLIISLCRQVGVEAYRLRPWHMLPNILELLEYVRHAPFKNEQIRQAEQRTREKERKFQEAINKESASSGVLEEDYIDAIDDFELVERELPPPPSNEVDLAHWMKAHRY